MILFLGGVDELVGVVPSHLGGLASHLTVGDGQETREIGVLALLAELLEAGNDRRLVDLQPTVGELLGEFHHEEILANCGLE